MEVCRPSARVGWDAPKAITTHTPWPSSPSLLTLTLLFTFFLLQPLLPAPRLLPLPLLLRLLPFLLLPRPLPRLLLLPLLLLLLHLLLLLLPNSPSPLLVTTSCETSHRLRLSGATPRDQARYPPTRIRPCHSGLPPLATSSAPSGLFQDQPRAVGTAVMA